MTASLQFPWEKPTPFQSDYEKPLEYAALATAVSPRPKPLALQQVSGTAEVEDGEGRS